MDISIYVSPKFSGQTSILGGFFLYPSLFFELRNKLNFTNCNFVLKAMGHGMLIYCRSVAYSDNLPVFPKAQVDNQLDFVVQLCLVISLIHSTQNFEVWFDALVEEQQVRAIIMAGPLLSSALRLTYLLSLLNSIRFLSYQLREFVSKLTLVCLILPNCSFVVK